MYFKYKNIYVEAFYMQNNIQIVKEQIEELSKECDNLKITINNNKIWNTNDYINSPEYIKTSDPEWRKLERRCKRVLDCCKSEGLLHIQELEDKIFSQSKIDLDTLDTIIDEFDKIMLELNTFEFKDKNKNNTENKVLNKNILSTDNGKNFSKIFVSHYSGDKEIVKCIIELLESIGFKKGTMFCTSVDPYGIKFGENSMDYIKKQFNSNTLVIFILTKNFFYRPVCMCEMGAAWVKAGASIPIIDPSLNYEEIKGVIKSKQGFKINDAEKLDYFYEMLKEAFGFKDIGITIWQRKKNQFIENINKLIDKKYTSLCNEHKLDNIKENDTYSVTGCVTDIEKTGRKSTKGKQIFILTLNNEKRINVYSYIDISEIVVGKTVIEACPFRSNDNVDFEQGITIIK
jgi:hypothetical protein